MNRLFLSLLCLSIPLLAAPVRALEVKETRWGFDGRVVQGHFNILSVRVAQNGARAFDGELVLRETRGGEGNVGAPLVQPLFLTPGTERWVQFTPFISAEYEWLIEWGRGPKERLKIDPAKSGAPATVLLADPTSAFASENRLKIFPEDLFPATVAATDGLDAVALDHVPRWEAPRRAAFLDWLRRGGLVHLLRGANGIPTFDGDLAVLNVGVPRERVGAGLVVRHDTTRAECSAEFLTRAGYAPRELVEGKGNVLYGFDQALLRGLAGLTRPEIAWWLIYLLTLAYLTIIGPLHYRWSKRYDYRVSLGIFLGTVVAFAIAFILAGRRGSGEVQIVNSVSIARSLGERRFDVMQWASAFATDGDLYKLTHSAPANLYSMTSDVESVNGRILNGRDGYFEVDIPLYSSRPFLHRGVMNGDDTNVQVSEWTNDRITLQAGKDFPSGVGRMWARSNTGFLEFEKHGGEWTWNRGVHPPQLEQNVFDSKKLEVINALQFQETALLWDNLFLPLVASALGGVEGMPNRSPARDLPRDQLQLFIYAPVPAGFHMQGKGFRHEKGWVLYVQDVFKPTAP
jgi:hypothetical protein